MFLQDDDINIRALVDESLSNFLSNAFENTSALTGFGNIFIGIGITITAFQVFNNPQTRTNLFAYLKWVPLWLLFIAYAPFVQTVIQFYEVIGQSFVREDRTWDIVFTKISAAEGYLWGNVSVWDLVDADFYKRVMTLSVMSIIMILGAIISTIAYVLIKTYAIIRIFILIVFGPLNIGLSFLPAFSGMWKAWLQKLISVAMWVPLLYLVDNFMLGIVSSIVDNIIVEDEVSMAPVLMGSLLIMMNAIVYFTVPKLAGLVVQGFNADAKGATFDKGKHYGKKAAKTAVAVKTGGASSAAGAVLQ